MVGVMVLKTLLIPLAIAFLVSLVVGNYPVKRAAGPGGQGGCRPPSRARRGNKRRPTTGPKSRPFARQG